MRQPTTRASHSPSPPSSPGQRGTPAANVLLLAISCILTVLGLEFGARIYKWEWGTQNFAAEQHDILRAAYPAQFDPLLGWAPRPGSTGRNLWNTRVTIKPEGVRGNGAPPPSGKDPILAVGDSFTFGDQVNDDETWPAVLERRLGVPVINGGVFGYGTDQTYLRMKALALRFRPTTIVFSLIPGDVYRCELAAKAGVPKPYFAPDGAGTLALRTGHVRPPGHTENELGRLRAIGGYSFFFFKLMDRQFPAYWRQGNRADVRVNVDGLDVTCRLFRTLAPYAQERGVRLLVLFQSLLSDDDRRITARLRSCLDDSRVTLLDLEGPLARVRDADPARFSRFFNVHMTAEGNRFVAAELTTAMAADKH